MKSSICSGYYSTNSQSNCLRFLISCCTVNKKRAIYLPLLCWSSFVSLCRTTPSDNKKYLTQCYLEIHLLCYRNWSYNSEVRCEGCVKCVPFICLRLKWLFISHRLSALINCSSSSAFHVILTLILSNKLTRNTHGG